MAERVMHVEFVVLTFAGLLLPVLAPYKTRRVGRRLFWGGLLVATISAFFIAYPSDWKLGIGLSVLVSGLHLMAAYSSTPFIKFRGKIYAISVDDTRPDPAPDGTPTVPGRPDPVIESYGGAITVQKLWRLLILLMGMCAFGIVGYFVDGENPRAAAVGAAMLVSMAALAGYIDASEGGSIARGQRVAFAIISLITAGAFTVIYLVAYRTGKHWPLRRHRQLRSRPDAARQPNRD